MPPTAQVFLTLKDKNSITVSWNPVGSVTGYQVWYSTDYNGPYKKLGNYKTTYVTHTGLSVGSRYYYRVRSYKAVGGTYVYSNWSSVHSATVK